MKVVPRALQSRTLKRLDLAMQAFFRRVKKGEKPGYPRFRGRGRYDTLDFGTYREHAPGRGKDGISFDGMFLTSKLFGRIKAHQHRPLPDDGKITTLKIILQHKQWWAHVGVELPDIPLRDEATISSPVGLDVGLTDLVTLSTGEKIPNLRLTRRREQDLRRKQRALARCRKGSRRRQKVREKVGRCHKKVRDSRNTYLHQVSARLVREYDLIAAEKLKTCEVWQSHALRSRCMMRHGANCSS